MSVLDTQRSIGCRTYDRSKSGDSVGSLSMLSRQVTDPMAGVLSLALVFAVAIVCCALPQVPLRMSVDQISFSAHADYAQTEGFIKALQPAHVVS